MPMAPSPRLRPAIGGLGWFSTTRSANIKSHGLSHAAAKCTKHNAGGYVDDRLLADRLRFRRFPEASSKSGEVLRPSPTSPTGTNHQHKD